MTDTTSAPRRGVPVWAQVIIWLGLLGLLAIMAFGLKRTQQGSVVVGDELPDFTVTFFEGYAYENRTEIKLSELKGKVVVLNFWASWCKPCEQEAADLESAWRYYQPTGQVIFLGADYVDTEPEARGYLTKFDITYPNGPDLGTRISQYFRIEGVPETYFIDGQGVLRFTKVGPFTSESEIRQVVDSLLGQ